MSYDRETTVRVTFDMPKELFARLEAFKLEIGERVTSVAVRRALDASLPKQKKTKEK